MMSHSQPFMSHFRSVQRTPIDRNRDTLTSGPVPCVAEGTA